MMTEADIKAEFESISKTLDQVSMKKRCRGRITSYVDGFRFFVTPNYRFNGSPYDGSFAVYVEKKTEFGARTIGKVVVTPADVIALVSGGTSAKALADAAVLKKV